MPQFINDTPELVLGKKFTHSLRGIAYYLKVISYNKNIKKYVQYLIATCVNLSTQSHYNFNMHKYG